MDKHVNLPVHGLVSTGSMSLLKSVILRNW